MGKPNNIKQGDRCRMSPISFLRTLQGQSSNKRPLQISYKHSPRKTGPTTPTTTYWTGAWTKSDYLQTMTLFIRMTVLMRSTKKTIRSILNGYHRRAANMLVKKGTFPK